MAGISYIRIALISIWISLIATSSAISADNNHALQPFTAQYQLNRGGMIIGKVTNTLQLDADGNYTYRSVTIPVGIVAVFSKDKITEESRGTIHGRQIVPSSYFYNHKRKKHPKLRKIEFDWSTNRATGTAASPPWSKDVAGGTQDSSSKILAMMLQLDAGAKDVELSVIDRNKLKRYRIALIGKEQLVAGNSKYDTVQLQEVKEGEAAGTKFWLAPKLNYLPIQVEKREKRETYTMKLVKYSQGEPEPPPAKEQAK